MADPTGPPRQGRPPLWRDVRVLRVAFQAAVLAIVLGIVAYLLGNFRTNSESLGIPTGFGFLDQPANFPIPDTSFRTSQPVRTALVIGLLNTLRVALAGIVLSTVLGTLLGIARLSSNWLLSTTARIYVEIVRNVPLLVLVVFSYVALFLRLPRLDEAATPLDAFVFSVRGVAMPWLTSDGQGWAFTVVLLVGVVAAVVVARWRRAVSDRTGQPARSGLLGLATFGLVTVAGYVVLGGPVSVSLPSVEGSSIVGGLKLSPEYAALLFSLTIYTASHIAEVVRGSIQAVPRGQTEAAQSVGLKGYQRMRLVVLPQALRIAIPPLTNQFLNLTKNSSLAVAISYFELTRVTATTIANGSPAIPALALLMVVYLAISVSLSVLTNIANRRLALVER